MNNVKKLDERDELRARDIEVDTPIHVVSVDTGIELTVKQISQGGINYIKDEYEGPYEVTPKTSEQVLPTKMKGMAKDVIVEAVPYIEVSNESGTTVIIATE